jgi:serine protease Do
MARSSAGAIDLEQGDAVTAGQNRSRAHCSHIGLTMDITALHGHWRTLRCLALALALALPWAARTAPMADARGAAASFAPALNRALPITLGVYGVAKAARVRYDDPQPQGDEGAEVRIGAGFLIDASGLAVTAAHVVQGCDVIAVKLADQRVVQAHKIGEDEDTDIALIRLPVSVPVPAFGRSSLLRPGDWVLAIGEPYGLNRSVSAGIVGGKDRHFAEEGDVLYIQSDLALNPGNSGGPLIDSSGTVVGMNMRTVVGVHGTPGVSLSIPIEVVLQIARELKSGGAIARPRLGADFHDLPPELALARGRPYAHGAVIERVASGSLAERAGLRVGDIVVGMNGKAIQHSAALARALLAWRQASGTRITVYRNGGFLQLTLD